MLRERFDEESQRFRIEVRVENPRFGPLFGYSGSFTCTYPQVGPGEVPAAVKPLREELRD